MSEKQKTYGELETEYKNDLKQAKYDEFKNLPKEELISRITDTMGKNKALYNITDGLRNDITLLSDKHEVLKGTYESSIYSEEEIKQMRINKDSYYKDLENDSSVKIDLDTLDKFNAASQEELASKLINEMGTNYTFTSLSNDLKKERSNYIKKLTDLSVSEELTPSQVSTSSKQSIDVPNNSKAENKEVEIPSIANDNGSYATNEFKQFKESALGAFNNLDQQELLDLLVKATYDFYKEKETKEKYKQSNAELKEELAESLSENKKLNTSKKRFSTELSNTKKKNKELESNFNELKSKYVETQEKLAVREKSSVVLENKLLYNQEKNKDLQSKLSASELKNTVLENNLKLKEKQNKELETKMGIQDKKLRHFQEKFGEVMSREIEHFQSNKKVSFKPNLFNTVKNKVSNFFSSAKEKGKDMKDDFILNRKRDYHSRFQKSRAFLKSIHDFTLKPAGKVVKNKYKESKRKFGIIRNKAEIEMNKSGINKNKINYATMFVAVGTKEAGRKLYEVSGLKQKVDYTMNTDAALKIKGAYNKASNNYKQNLEANKEKAAEIEKKIENKKLAKETLNK